LKTFNMKFLTCLVLANSAAAMAIIPEGHALAGRGEAAAAVEAPRARDFARDVRRGTGHESVPQVVESRAAGKKNNGTAKFVLDSRAKKNGTAKLVPESRAKKNGTAKFVQARASGKKNGTTAKVISLRHAQEARLV
jgi:hypothetical protein